MVEGTDFDLAWNVEWQKRCSAGGSSQRYFTECFPIFCWVEARPKFAKNFYLGIKQLSYYNISGATNWLNACDTYSHEHLGTFTATDDQKMKLLTVAFCIVLCNFSVAQSLLVGLSIGGEVGTSKFIPNGEVSPNFRLIHPVGAYLGVSANFEFVNRFFLELELYQAQDYTGAKIHDNVTNFGILRGPGSGFQSLSLGIPLKVGSRNKFAAVLGIAHYKNQDTGGESKIEGTYKGNFYKVDLYDYQNVNGHFLLAKTGIRFTVISRNRSVINLNLIAQLGFKFDSYQYFSAEFNGKEYFAVVENKHDLISLSLQYQFRIVKPKRS